MRGRMTRLAALLATAIAWGCVPSGGGNGGGDGDGGPARDAGVPPSLVPAEQAAGDICGRAIQCGVYAAEDERRCLSAEGRYAFVVVDRARFRTCIAETDCDAYAADLIGNVGRCLDLDANTFDCQSDDIRFCNRSGQCRTIDCRDGCEFFYGLSYQSCDFDPNVGYQRCICGFGP